MCEQFAARVVSFETADSAVGCVMACSDMTGRLLVVAQARHHIKQLVECDKSSTVTRFIGIDRGREFIDFGTVSAWRGFELTAFRSTGARFARSAAIDESVRVLFDKSFHYDGSGSEMFVRKIARSWLGDGTIFDFVKKCPKRRLAEDNAVVDFRENRLQIRNSHE